MSELTIAEVRIRSELTNVRIVQGPNCPTFEYTSHWQKWHLTLKHHTEEAIKSFSDDMQWEFIISYLFL